ncbi:hypothetical protein CN957_06315 [Bacillus cereus]|uniref:Uncharacterized protein n=1 Tax=Bacillus nitratireducens TaxID=2026193 RepID=A0ABU6PLN4_9BACI|nr:MULTISPECIES: hypothetical protein [Bacillus cereus group]PFK01428.1 hypothetical protein COI97_15810 [Bacillus cereus]MED4681763.1 hypothetical protein [Bacillus nitratireducens]PGM85033.1 hypothetical protein CN957_06315 [Bacillus cereus]PGW34446.1 hypothetical protein COE04_15275 [Bacillus cereus]QWI35779.1 hypothetical protein EXW43_00410 [Bacillus mycoides]
MEKDIIKVRDKDRLVFDYREKREEGYTSPASALPTHELKMLQEYMHGANLKVLGECLPERKQVMMLMKFFKHKRYQRVEVFSNRGGSSLHTVAKVNEIGRDFVVLTTLMERIFIPYTAIQNANIPYAIPNISTSHQHLIYDENLRKKLMLQFGKTVAEQVNLKQQFFEEAFMNHLQLWEDTYIKLYDKKEVYTGRITKVTNEHVYLKKRSNTQEIAIRDITYINIMRIFTLFSSFVKRVKKRLHQLRKNKVKL